MRSNDTGEAVDLARFDTQWSNTKAPAEEIYSDIPDGTYEAVIEDARVSATASTGRPIVLWTLRISGPEAVNRVVTKNRVITENTLTYLREDLEKCGLPLHRLSDLPERIHDLVGQPVGIDKRTKDGKANIYFRLPELTPF